MEEHFLDEHGAFVGGEYTGKARLCVLQTLYGDNCICFHSFYVVCIVRQKRRATSARARLSSSVFIIVSAISTAMPSASIAGAWDSSRWSIIMPWMASP